MSEHRSEPNLIEIQRHQKSRELEVTFEDGSHFKLPCEYLRVYSPVAKVKVMRDQGEWSSAKESVGIAEIIPVGNYSINLRFDDGHDTGIYFWQTLWELG